jgi:hypothetical protein
MKITKTALLAFFLLCSAAAFAQVAGSVSSTVVLPPMPEHVEHAEAHPMAVEHSLVGGGSDTYTSYHGERPLWEFGPVAQHTPLGDVARAYRKERMTGKKAEITLEKQGN